MIQCGKVNGHELRGDIRDYSSQSSLQVLERSPIRKIRWLRLLVIDRNDLRLDRRNPPPPPDHLGDPERAIWTAITDDWKGSSASFFVLTSTLEAHQRAREAREVIDGEGKVIARFCRAGQEK